MRNALLNQLQLDCADATVVHVGRRNAVSASVSICHSHVRDAVDGKMVVQSAIFAQDAAVPVGCVFAKTDIGADVELGEALPQQPDALDHGSFRVICCRAQSILDSWCQWNTKEDDGL